MDSVRRLDREEYLDALRDQNPWLGLGVVPAALARSVRRPLANELWKAMLGSPFRHQVVLGPRRVGKTVAMYQTVQALLDHGIEPSRLWFLRLDHPLLMHHQLGSWTRSLIRNFGASADRPLFLFLDEVNYSEQWDKWLKTFYDEQWPVRVAATSSSTAALRNRTVESGIGRWSEQFLTPYSYGEFLALQGSSAEFPQASGDLHETLCATIEAKRDYTAMQDSLWMFLLVGGFPELLSSLTKDDIAGEIFRSQQVLRSEAVQRVTGMDIPQAFDIRHPLVLEKLLYLLAGQMCGLMEVTNLSNEVGLTRATIHQYISYLERAFLIFTLPNYAPSEEKVQRKGRKVFFVDGAVRNAALQRGLAPRDNAHERGHLIENAVASHLYALSLQSGSRLFYWREKKHEVDFVYGDPGKLVAVEVSTRPDHSLTGLRAIQQRRPELRGRCFLVTFDSVVYRSPAEDEDGVGRMPLQAFLLAVGAEAWAALRRRLGVQ